MENSSGNDEVDYYMLVIAHPDDESMFFAPTIRSLCRHTNGALHILCLCNGDCHGVGSTREKELHRAVRVLLGNNDNGPIGVTVLHDDRLLDGPTRVWDPPTVASLVYDHLTTIPSSREHKTVAIITFDPRGVSGHANHIDTFRGIRYLLSSHQQQQLDSSPRITVRAVWMLETISNPFFKYVPFGDWAFLLLSTLYRHLWPNIVEPYNHHDSSSTGDDMDAQPRLLDDENGNTITLWLFDPRIVWDAMSAHATQFVWYRRLSVLFSRYTYRNKLTLLSLRDDIREEEISIARKETWKKNR